MELRVRERKNDCQDRATDVAEEKRKERRNAPIPPHTDDDVQVAAQLVALLYKH